MEWAIYQGHPKTLQQASILDNEYEAFRTGRSRRNVPGGKICSQRIQNDMSKSLNSAKNTKKHPSNEDLQVSKIIKELENRGLISPHTPTPRNRPKGTNYYYYYWIDDCRKLAREIPISYAREQVKWAYKNRKSPEAAHPSCQMSLVGKTIPANLNQETTGDLNCGTINMTEEQSYTSDVNGIVSGTVQDTSEHLIPPAVLGNESLYLPSQ